MFHAYWPATAFVTLCIIVGVIMAMLRFGPRWCRLRHTALESSDWEHRTYEQNVSYA